MHHLTEPGYIHQQVRELAAQALANPLPTTLAGRLDLLERHLHAVLGTPGLAETSFTAETAAATSTFAPVLSEVIRASAPGSIDDPSDCDSAAVTGVALITLGAIGGGPVGAVAGFVYGVALLASAC